MCTRSAFGELQIFGSILLALLSHISIVFMLMVEVSVEKLLLLWRSYILSPYYVSFGLLVLWCLYPLFNLFNVILEGLLSIWPSSGAGGPWHLCHLREEKMNHNSVVTQRQTRYWLTVKPAESNKYATVKNGEEFSHNNSQRQTKYWCTVRTNETMVVNL